MSTPMNELRVELIKGLSSRDPTHGIYEVDLPPADVQHPFYYIGDLRGSEEGYKRQLLQDVSLTVHVWHDNPYRKADVFQMLAVIGSVVRSIEENGSPSYTWAVIGRPETRVLSDKISATVDSKTVYVHGVYEAHIKQIGSR